MHFDATKCKQISDFSSNDIMLYRVFYVSGIILAMWYNICEEDVRGAVVVGDGDGDGAVSGARSSWPTVDCRGSNYGVFFGILTAVATVIGATVFAVLLRKPGLGAAAAVLLSVLQGALCVASLGATALAAWRVDRLRFAAARSDWLHEALLAATLAALFVLELCVALAAAVAGDATGAIVAGVAVGQASVTAVFVAGALRRHAPGPAPGPSPRRPGRQCIAFLVIAHVALYGVALLPRPHHDVACAALYGGAAWRIVATLAGPLAALHRFVVAVCLAAVYRNAFKEKPS